MSRREELFSSGAQFGHQTRAWCPKMVRYIWGEKDGIHLINLAITEFQIEKAEKMLEEIAQKGLSILWVGTKRVARAAVTRCAQETGQPYFSERWIGGTLTNYQEVKKAVTNMLYNKEILEKADRQLYTKKELSKLQKKIERAEKSVGGIERLGQKLGALVIVGTKEERVALREACKMGIPVIALVDTNCDPTGVSVVVPANDDRESSISLILGYFAEAVKRGKEAHAKNNPAAEDQEDKKQHRSGHGHKKQHHEKQHHAHAKGEKRHHVEAQRTEVPREEAVVKPEAIVVKSDDVKKEHVSLKGKKPAGKVVEQSSEVKVAPKAHVAEAEEKKQPAKKESAVKPKKEASVAMKSESKTAKATKSEVQAESPKSAKAAKSPAPKAKPKAAKE